MADDFELPHLPKFAHRMFRRRIRTISARSVSKENTQRITHPLNQFSGGFGAPERDARRKSLAPP